MTSIFHLLPRSSWISSTSLAFAVHDGFPVSSGHVLIVTRRVVPKWFEATEEERSALMSLVNEVKLTLDERLKPKPDGYNVGFNAGEAAGQTVPHLHIHVIPRYKGDVADPRGGIRHVIPGNVTPGAMHHLPQVDLQIALMTRELSASVVPGTAVSP